MNHEEPQNNEPASAGARRSAPVEACVTLWLSFYNYLFLGCRSWISCDFVVVVLFDRMLRQRLQWVCPFGEGEGGGVHHPGGRQHVVNSRLAFRRHLTLIHSSDLVRCTTADDQP